MGDFLSAETLAPLSCQDGVQNGDELDVDCGGSCFDCGLTGDAEAAIKVKLFYDLYGVWSGTYLIGAIYNLVWAGDTAIVHYGYANPGDVNTVVGQDSRTYFPL